MAIWLCVIAGVTAGIVSGGCNAFRLARRFEFAQANTYLRRGARVAAICSIVVSCALLGWPFKTESISMPEEVTKTVMETVEVAVTVPSWIFFTTTKREVQQVPKVVTETVFHERTFSSLSVWLLFPMALVGWISYQLELRCVRLAWRRWA